MKKPETPTLQRKAWLLSEKERLEKLIGQMSTDMMAATIRADYRAVINELGEYFDDINLESEAPHA
ncbi:MAG: hypothetical protein ACXVIY_03120 [Mucilaginibacter sp.]